MQGPPLMNRGHGCLQFCRTESYSTAFYFLSKSTQTNISVLSCMSKGFLINTTPRIHVTINWSRGERDDENRSTIVRTDSAVILQVVQEQNFFKGMFYDGQKMYHQMQGVGVGKWVPEFISRTPWWRGTRRSHHQKWRNGAEKTHHWASGTLN